jgi:hypothetical protein
MSTHGIRGVGFENVSIVFKGDFWRLCSFHTDACETVDAWGVWELVGEELKALLGRNWIEKGN